MTRLLCFIALAVVSLLALCAAADLAITGHGRQAALALMIAAVAGCGAAREWRERP
jgi:hypothetical protein